MKVRIADLNFEIRCKYNYLKKQCRDYIAEFETPDEILSVTEDEIDRENVDGADFDRGYFEGLAIYRKIAEKVIEYDGFLMHGVLIEADGKGVLFTAKSGVGKSTHAAMWRRYLGRERCRIINGDKPILRFVDGKLYAYGTPWCGKEGMQENRKIELCSIAFIERGQVNEAFQITSKECFQELISQIHFPSDDALVISVIDLCGRLIQSVRFFKIKCTPDVEAAEVATRAIL